MYTEVLLLPRSNSGSDYNSATIWSLGAALSDSGREIYVTGYELADVIADIFSCSFFLLEWSL